MSEPVVPASEAVTPPNGFPQPQWAPAPARRSGRGWLLFGLGVVTGAAVLGAVWLVVALPGATAKSTAFELKGTMTLVDSRLGGSSDCYGTGGYKDYFNSVLALDRNVRAVQWYDKHHLVPYTEVFPVPGFVRTWMGMMNLGYSDFTRGAPVQPPLRAGGLALSASICYEDGYGSSQLPVLSQADTLVNVTNDAWFGHGSARYLHFQIARMRAIEAQRYMIRAGNDGISAVIGPRGEIVAEAPGFVRHVLRSEVTPRKGLPPYAYVGNWLIISLSSAGVVLGVWLARRARKKAVG